VTIERKKVLERVLESTLFEKTGRYFDEDTFDGPVDDVISRISLIKEAVKDLGYEDAYIEVTRHWDDVEIEVKGTRWETDKELQKRQRASEAAKKSAVARKIKEREARRIQYKKLQKEFG